MKERYWLTKRGSMFYSLDSETRERKSLGITDRRAALKIIQAKNESTNRPALGLSLARAYIAAYDQTLVNHLVIPGARHHAQTRVKEFFRIETFRHREFLRRHLCVAHPPRQTAGTTARHPDLAV